MSSDAKKPATPSRTAKHEPANPAAERVPGESAKPGNRVKAKDAFGAARPDLDWTPEAIQSQTRQPSFGGAGDEVRKEQIKETKG